MREFVAKYTELLDIALNELKNLNETQLIAIALAIGGVLLFSLFLIILLKLFKSKAQVKTEKLDSTLIPVYEKIDKIEKHIQGLQQDRARYQQSIAIKMTDLRDNLDDLKLSFSNSGINSYVDSFTTNPEKILDKDSKKSEKNINTKSTVQLERIDIEDSIENIVSEPKIEEAKPEIKVEKKEESQDEKALAVRDGLRKTRVGFFVKIKELFSGKDKISEEDLDELEAILVSSDMGMSMTNYFLDRLKEDQIDSGLTKDNLIFKLKKYIIEVLDIGGATTQKEETYGEAGKVILCVGVNGVGKTTSVAKLARNYKEAGKKVLLVAADTFRAAAVEQLESWATKLDVEIVKGNEKAKPAAVVFDAMDKAKAENFDVVLIDTAGRLHNKSNLMQELEGIRNVVRKTDQSAPHEVLLVVDGATGQNALIQAKEFKESVNPTGLVVTKLDGTPKGGIVVAIQYECDIPVKYIGVGEKESDLKDFNAENFVSELFNETYSV